MLTCALVATIGALIGGWIGFAAGVYLQDHRPPPKSALDMTVRVVFDGGEVEESWRGR